MASVEAPKLCLAEWERTSISHVGCKVFCGVFLGGVVTAVSGWWRVKSCSVCSALLPLYVLQAAPSFVVVVVKFEDCIIFMLSYRLQLFKTWYIKCCLKELPQRHLQEWWNVSLLLRALVWVVTSMQLHISMWIVQWKLLKLDGYS